MTPSAAVRSNPFATRYVRPGAIPFLFPRGTTSSKTRRTLCRSWPLRADSRPARVGKIHARGQPVGSADGGRAARCRVCTARCPAADARRLVTASSGCACPHDRRRRLRTIEPPGPLAFARRLPTARLAIAAHYARRCRLAHVAVARARSERCRGPCATPAGRERRCRRFGGDCSLLRRPRAQCSRNFVRSVRPPRTVAAPHGALALPAARHAQLSNATGCAGGDGCVSLRRGAACPVRQQWRASRFRGFFARARNLVLKFSRQFVAAGVFVLSWPSRGCAVLPFPESVRSVDGNAVDPNGMFHQLIARLGKLLDDS